MKKMKSVLGGLTAALVLSMGVWANTTLTVQTMTQNGLTPTRTTIDATITYDVRNDGKTFLEFVKTGANSSVVTVATTITVGGLAVADVPVTVDELDGHIFIGPFNTRLFNNGSGNLTFTVTNTAAITVAVLKL